MDIQFVIFYYGYSGLIATRLQNQNAKHAQANSAWYDFIQTNARVNKLLDLRNS